MTMSARFSSVSVLALGVIEIREKGAEDFGLFNFQKDGGGFFRRKAGVDLARYARGVVWIDDFNGR